MLSWGLLEDSFGESCPSYFQIGGPSVLFGLTQWPDWGGVHDGIKNLPVEKQCLN